MTLGELRRELALYLGLDATSSDGLVAYWDTELLNNAAREIAILFSIPRLTITFTKTDMQTGPLVMPNTAEEVLRVIAPPDEVVPIVDIDDYVPDPQGFEYPSMRYGSDALFILDRHASPITLLYVGPQHLEPPPVVKVVYRPQYQPMQNESDVPWNGQFARFHGVIAARAAMAALLSLDPGDQETLMRYKRAQESYQEMARLLREEVDRLMYLQGPSIRPFMYDRGRRWQA